MKIDLFNRIVWFSCSFLFISCFSNSESRCLGSICFDAALEKKEEAFLIKLSFLSEIDTSLYLNDQMFAIGCPLYQEDKSYFDGKSPALDDLKFSQIILENEEGNYRVFSSQFIDSDGQSILMMPNCAFMTEKKIKLDGGHTKTIEFSIEKKTDILVEKTDNRIRFHIYYKNPPGEEAVLSSNWLVVP